jgi:hypothetical protein
VPDLTAVVHAGPAQMWESCTLFALACLGVRRGVSALCCVVEAAGIWCCCGCALRPCSGHTLASLLWLD